MTEYAGLFSVFVTGISLWLVVSHFPEISLPDASIGEIEQNFNGGSMLFVGDIMLGRHVERLMQENGPEYPFLGMRALIESADISIGNFEGSVPQQHTRTPDRTLVFSMHERSLEVLKAEGFDLLSLANNHSFDYLSEGYANTLLVCEQYRLICPGHSRELGDMSSAQVVVGDTIVGLIFLHATAKPYAGEELTTLLQSILRETEVQIVFVHWGQEYQTYRASEQEELGHFLIDSGVDAVVGHHPHVIQDIEIYKEKPIFYSLGNFIFDQYFDEAVQTGLGVKIEIGKRNLTYTLIPFSSVETPSQPHIMAVDDKERFLTSLQFTGLSKDNILSNPFVISW